MHSHILAAAAAVAMNATAAAGQLVIAPTTVTLQPDRHSTVVTVHNASDQPVDLQMRGYDWTQPDGHDTLAPADDLIISPAIATVPAHGKQAFRILLAAATPLPGGRERAWRLRLNQLPRDDQPSVSVNLEFLLPVFQGADDSSPHLAWRRTGDGGVAVTNIGGRRARLTRLALAEADGAPVELAGAVSAYLLSGATRTFAPAIPRSVPVGARLIATGDTGPLDAMPAALAAR